MQTTFYILYVQKEFVSPGEDDVDEIFYVGRTSRKLEERLRQHFYDAKYSKSKKALSIKSKLESGRKIKIQSIVSTHLTNKAQISAIEMDLIKTFAKCGHALVNTVYAENNKESSYTNIAWNERYIALLGAVTDRQAAKIIGCSDGTVRAKRQELGILPYVQPIQWTEECLALLGTMSDKNVAHILKIGETTVKRKRDELGIIPYSEQPGVLKHPKTLLWTEEELCALGQKSDSEIAKEKRCSPEAVRKKRIKLNINAYDGK